MIAINGRPNTEEIAHAIVIRILNESLVKYHGTRLGNNEVKELSQYVKKELEEIIEYVEKGERRCCSGNKESNESEEEWEDPDKDTPWAYEQMEHAR